MLSRRKFLLSASATAAAVVAKANAPLQALESLVENRPAWLPEGFILPQGQALSRLMYPELHAAVRDCFGAGPTTFKLPDFGRSNAGSIKTIMALKHTGNVPAGTLISFYAGNENSTIDIPSQITPNQAGS